MHDAPHPRPGFLLLAIPSKDSCILQSPIQMLLLSSFPWEVRTSSLFSHNIEYFLLYYLCMCFTSQIHHPPCRELSFIFVWIFLLSLSLTFNKKYYESMNACMNISLCLQTDKSKDIRSIPKLKFPVTIWHKSHKPVTITHIKEKCFVSM